MKQRYSAIIFSFLWLVASQLPASSAFSRDGGTGESKGTTTSGSSQVSVPDSDKIYPMHQMIITATRTEKEMFDVPREVVVVERKELEDRNIRFTPDALAESPSILIQKTNYGGGAPVIRGLIGNQVLILVDGIRLNNSTFRFGPNQYLNTVNPSLIERVEVVEGPGSVLYGSDALGGTINLITRDLRNVSLSGLRSMTTVATADKSVIQHFDYQGGSGNFNYLIGGGYQKFNDLSAGNGYQHPTGYSGYDGNARLDYALDSRQRLTLSYQLTELNDVPRTDRIVGGNDKKYMYNPQRNELAYFSYQGAPELSFIHNIKTTLSYNRQREGREIISMSKQYLETRDLDEVTTLGANVELHSILNSENLLTYGFEFYFDNVSSTRDTTNFNLQTTGSAKPQFPDGATYQTFGAFVQDQIDFRPLFIVAGLRYSAFRFKGTLDQPFGETISTPSDVTFSLNAAYRLLDERLNLVAGIAEGFRAPNLDDIAVFGKSGSGAGARFDVPSPNLNPERSINYEAGIKFREETVGGSLFYYYSTYNDLIVPKPGTYNGSDLYQGIPVYQRFNVGNANIQGINFSSYYQASPLLKLRTDVSWTLGGNLTDNEPLSRIPPFRGIIGVTYTGEAYWLEYYNLLAANQTRLATSDIKDARIGPNGTPGYVTFNLRGGYDISEHINANITFENILDKLYKLHGSGVYSPGRNVIVSLIIHL
ncbi:MAG: TonB-dependent receptor [Bacteroidetes bacterium]|nr:MAG: TonB-dependent receptor [Bacteroidota bacterium]